MVIQTAFLGDVILATALLESLHEACPDAEIHFLLRKGNERIMEGHPYLKRLWVLDKSRKYRSMKDLITGMRREKFDLLVNLQRFFTSGALTFFSGAAHTTGFRKNPLSFAFSEVHDHDIDTRANSPHETERNFRLISSITSAALRRPALYPQKHHEDELQPYLPSHGNYICLAPASVWFTKQWPATRWIAFLDRIPQELTVFLLGGPGDKPMCEEIAGLVDNPHLSLRVLAGSLSPLASAALMGKAIMNYVNDSAPLHMCSGLNAPVTVVYCSTVPAFGFTPLSDNRHILEIPEALPCRPCGLHGYASCPEGHFKCALDIPVEFLLQTLPETGSSTSR